MATAWTVGADRKQVTHVAKLQDMQELEAMKPFLREAYEYSISGSRASR